MATEIIADLIYKVKADTSSLPGDFAQVESKWDAQKRKIEGKGITPKFLLDDRKLEQDIDRLFRKVERTAKIKVNLDTSDAERKLDVLSRRMSSMGAGGNGNGNGLAALSSGAGSNASVVGQLATAAATHGFISRSIRTAGIANVGASIGYNQGIIPAVGVAAAAHHQIGIGGSVVGAASGVAGGVSRMATDFGRGLFNSRDPQSLSFSAGRLASLPFRMGGEYLGGLLNTGDESFSRRAGELTRSGLGRAYNAMFPEVALPGDRSYRMYPGSTTHYASTPSESGFGFSRGPRPRPSGGGDGGGFTVEPFETMVAREKGPGRYPLGVPGGSMTDPSVAGYNAVRFGSRNPGVAKNFYDQLIAGDSIRWKPGFGPGGGTFGGPVGAKSDVGTGMSAMQIEPVPMHWAEAWQNAPGGRPAMGVPRFKDASYAAAQLGHVGSGGPVGPWMGNGRFFSNGGNGNGSSAMGNFFRRGQNFFQNNLTRAVGGYAIANAAEQGLSAYNANAAQYAGAMSGGDFVQQQVSSLRENQPGLRMASALTFGVSNLGVELGDALDNRFGSFRRGDPNSWSGGRASRSGIIAMQGATSLQNMGGKVRLGTESGRLSTLAGIASAQGDFAGQREAISDEATRTVTEQLQSNADQINELSPVASMKTHGNADLQMKRRTARNTIAALKKQNDQLRPNSDRLTAARIAAINREEQADIISDTSRTRSLNLQGVDDLESRRESIRGSYDAQIAGTTDPAKINRLKAQQGAALGATNREFGFGTQDLAMANKSGAYGLASKQFANAFRGFDASRQAVNQQSQDSVNARDQALRGLNANDPTQKARIDQINARYNQEQAGFTSDLKRINGDQKFATWQTGYNANTTFGQAAGASPFDVQRRNLYSDYQSALRGPNGANLSPQLTAQYNANLALVGGDQARQQIGVGSNVRSLGSQAAAQRLLNDGNPLAAEATGIIDSTRSQIVSTNLDQSLTPTQRAAMNSKFKDLAQARLEGITRILRHDNHAEFVSGYTTRGDDENTRFKDLKRAEDIAKQAGRSLDNADKDSNVTGGKTTGGGFTAQQATDAVKWLEQIARNIGVQ